MQELFYHYHRYYDCIFPSIAINFYTVSPDSFIFSQAPKTSKNQPHPIIFSHFSFASITKITSHVQKFIKNLLKLTECFKKEGIEYATIAGTWLIFVDLVKYVFYIYYTGLLTRLV